MNPLNVLSPNNKQKAAKNEIKSFLSNDFIERMIRVEQRVSASFSEQVPYKKTNYYQSLTPHEKKEFDEYLKKKNVRNKFLISLISLILLLLVGNGLLTGRIISEKTGLQSNTLTGTAVVLLVVVILTIVLISVSRIKKTRRFENHFKELDEITKGKSTKRIIDNLKNRLC